MGMEGSREAEVVSGCRKRQKRRKRRHCVGRDRFMLHL
jgi:hypothetical protein